MRKKYLALIHIGALLLATSLFAETTAEKIDALSKRIEELERAQSEFQFDEPRPKVNSFLNNNLTLGGFFEPGYTVASGPDTDFQAGTMNIFALNFSAEFNNGFRFNSQYITAFGVVLANPHNDADAPASLPSTRKFSQVITASLLTQGTLEYSFNRELNIQGGLGYSPFGYSFQEREIVLFHRRGGPQMLRAGGNLVSPLWEGIHIFGSFASGRDSWGYNAYTFSPPKKINALGLGGRLWWANENKDIVAGVSGQVAKENEETPETVGADLKFDFFPFTIRTEALKQFSKDSDPWSFYIEPGIYTNNEEFLFYVFGDYLHNPKNTTTPTLRDPISKWEYGGGVNWLPTSFTRIRLGFTYNDYVGETAREKGQNRDYLSVDISAGVAF